MNIAVVWEMILACEWGRIWWGITHAHWANVWASISAIFTTLAVIVAWRAMLRWNKQDKLKAKQHFKSAISIYAWELTGMSNFIGEYPRNPNAVDNIDEINNLFYRCLSAWEMCEGELENNPKVTEHWNEIYKKHRDFVGGKVSSDELLVHCEQIRKERFVFS